MVICLERGADLHMAQLMPLPLTVSCSSKIQIGFTFLVPAHLTCVVSDKGLLNGCVCVCVCVCSFDTTLEFVEAIRTVRPAVTALSVVDAASITTLELLVRASCLTFTGTTFTYRSWMSGV